jgi:molybdopterin-guanine dinucleotide biosynthesis protein A
MTRGVDPTAGIVLAGGRSSRMGRPKAGLDWHGQPLLGRVAGILARCGLRPVVVVTAPGMALPPLPDAVEVVEDEHEGRGPLAGLAGGLAAVERRAETAFASGTDVPFLLPDFVLGVVAALGEGFEAAAPRTASRLQPLPAAYRTSLRARAEALLAAGTAALTALLEASATRYLGEDELRAFDPALTSLENLNDSEAYEHALARPLPSVRVELRRTPADLGQAKTVRAATLAAALQAAGCELAGRTVELNGRTVAAEPSIPLVDGDRIEVDVASHA